MCGFVMILRKSLADAAVAGILPAMGEAIRHRGPDESGYRDVGLASMGHYRLSIIDLNGGKQPMPSRDGRLWLIFNGEIYNYRDVRRELKELGHHFEETSDTEVLLKAWQEWGPGCLSRLNGMFALAVYDAERGRLTAARDRFGEKPLYFCETEDAVYLASELKALIAAGVVDTRIDHSALHSFLTLGFVTGEQSIFRNVRRLLPGHMLTCAPQSPVEQRPWYALSLPTEELEDTESLAEESLAILRDSVRLRLVADVPVGCFLSGGVDSSAVVALAAEASANPIETFSIGFADPRYDERPHARFVAKRFGTRHQEFVLQPQGVEVLDRIAWHADEPFADAAALPTWFLSELTRRQVKVALSGDGGDEIFAGYDVYRSYGLSERVRQVPAFLRSATTAGLRVAAPIAGTRSRSLLRLARNIEDAGLAAEDRFMAKQQTVFREAFLQDRLRGTGGFLSAGCEALRPMRQPGLSPLGAIAAWQQRVSLPDDMLHKVDRMSMAHGLEVRAPFLDHRLCELLNRASFAAKVPGGRTKFILRHALERYLPADFLWRPKQGFQVPIAGWFKDDLAGFIRDRLLAPRAIIHHAIPRTVIQELLGQHARGRRDWSGALYGLLMFELWARSFGLTQDSMAADA
jgi:asparagine synthase (glutamine-hydrolysing)